MRGVLHEKCLQVIYDDKSSSYDKLLLKYNLVSIHHRNNQNLAIEMFEVKNHTIMTIFTTL